jgi:hypothetical protein
MERTPVESSNMASVGYDESTSTLEVEFKGRGGKPRTLYHYMAVPSKVHEALMATESKGRFLNTEIKGKYDYRKVKQTIRIIPPEVHEALMAAESY